MAAEDSPRLEAPESVLARPNKVGGSAEDCHRLPAMRPLSCGRSNWLKLSVHLLMLLTLASPIFAWIVDFNNPIVHTQYGSIRGKIDERKTKFNRRPICTFLSIPYARAPVGSNRFLVSHTRGQFCGS